MTTKRQRTALVTGGARRIGEAIVRDLAANGFKICFSFAGSDDCADLLVEKLNTNGVVVCAIEADLTEAAQCKNLFDEAVRAVGTIDLLVNNASIFEPDSAYKFNEELWDKHFAIHTKAPAILSAAMAEQVELEEGLVVNIIDQRVLRPNPKFYSYSLSKSALWTATRISAQALAPRIRVNAIGPGPTLKNSRQEQSDFDMQLGTLLLKRGPALREFGETIRYFYNTPSITGQMIALDGGQHLAWETADVADVVE